MRYINLRLTYSLTYLLRPLPQSVHVAGSFRSGSVLPFVCSFVRSLVCLSVANTYWWQRRLIASALTLH